MKPSISVSLETIIKCCDDKNAGPECENSHSGNDVFNFLIKAMKKYTVKICTGEDACVNVRHAKIWIAQVLMTKFGYSEQQARDVVLWELVFIRRSEVIDFYLIDDRFLECGGTWKQVTESITS